MKLTSLTNFKALFQAHRHLTNYKALRKVDLHSCRLSSASTVKLVMFIPIKNTLVGEFKYGTHFLILSEKIHLLIIC
jgi:hypothetical protein